MSPSFLICKESKIESNTSFYGCFHMGPFEPNQSVTIANSLRRTLLSELYGLAITSVEIEGASHEYSNLKGVNESVLDIILNLKHLVLKKTFYSLRPLVGYLRVQGPANVYASDLRLPPFVQCVDPNHLIATLEEDGVLTMRVLIQYGHKWLSPPNHFFTIPKSNEFTNLVNSVPDQKDLKMRPVKKDVIESKKETGLSKKERKEKEKQEEEKRALDAKKEADILDDLYSLPRKNLKNLLNFHFIRRRFLFNQVKKVGFLLSKTYIETLSKQSVRLLKRAAHLQQKTDTLLSRWTIKKRYPGLDLKRKHSRSTVELLEISGSNLKSRSYYHSAAEKREGAVNPVDSTSKKRIRLTPAKKWVISKQNSRPITIDAVFNPVNKVNFSIESNDYKTTLEHLSHSEEVSEFYKLIRASNSKTVQFFSRISQDRISCDATPSFVSPSEARGKGSSETKKQNRSNSLIHLAYRRALKKKMKKEKGLALLRDPKATFLTMFLDYQKELNLLKNNSPKDNIILEIWTNGSLHPREALYQTFSNLLQVFSKLNEITPFLNILTHFAKVPSEANPSTQKMNKTMKKQWGPALKQIKAGKIETTSLAPLIPVTCESYLATYMAPHVRNFKTVLRPYELPKPIKSIKSSSIKSIKPIKLLKPLNATSTLIKTLKRPLLPSNDSFSLSLRDKPKALLRKETITEGREGLQETRKIRGDDRQAKIKEPKSTAAPVNVLKPMSIKKQISTKNQNPVLALIKTPPESVPMKVKKSGKAKALLRKGTITEGFASLGNEEPFLVRLKGKETGSESIVSRNDTIKAAQTKETKLKTKSKVTAKLTEATEATLAETKKESKQPKVAKKKSKE